MLGLHFGPRIPTHDPRVMADIRQVYGDMPGVAVVMEGSSWIGKVLPPGSVVVQRYAWMFDGIKLDRFNEEACYEYGKSAGRMIPHVELLVLGVTHVMALCEPSLATIEDGNKVGAFEAGFSDIIVPRGLGFAGLNASMGKPESASAPTHLPVLEAYAKSYHRWSNTGGFSNPKFILCYHGYTDGETDATWLETRPWDIWEKDLEAIGLVMPPVLLTEAGIDTGVEPNGYRFNTTSERYATYIKGLPRLLPEAKGICIFGYGLTEDWERRGFDCRGDEVVLAALAEANREENMPQSIKERFAREYGEWVSAGGDPDGDFRRHLLGIGVISPNRAEYIKLCEQMKSLVEQIKLVGLRLPK